MQAPDDGSGGGGRDGGDGGAGAPGGPGCPGGPSVQEGTGAEGVAAGDAPLVEGPSRGPRQGADALVEGAESEQLEFALMVPFLSFMDAEIAGRYLVLSIDPFGGAVHREFTVIRSELLIRLTAENSSLLQISVASLLNQLTTVVVVQAMPRFVPQVFLKPHPGKGG